MAFPRYQEGVHHQNGTKRKASSLSERTIKCGKAGCACANDPKARHGPYFSLTQAVEGKTRSRFLTAERAAVAQQQIAAGRQFREHVDTYWEACQEWGRRRDPASAGLLGGGQKKTLQTELQSDLVQEIETLLGSQSRRDLDFEAVDMALNSTPTRIPGNSRISLDGVFGSDWYGLVHVLLRDCIFTRVAPAAAMRVEGLWILYFSKLKGAY